jgi:hypothetical protein
MTLAKAKALLAKFAKAAGGGRVAKHQSLEGRSKVNWSKGIRRFWIAASLLWVIGLVSTDYAYIQLVTV